EFAAGTAGGHRAREPLPGGIDAEGRARRAIVLYDAQWQAAPRYLLLMQEGRGGLAWSGLEEPERHRRTIGDSALRLNAKDPAGMPRPSSGQTKSAPHAAPIPGVCWSDVVEQAA